ncbi:hypothetical protein IFM89_033613 [Coptis chinensis]|uniref:Uncharacterized protein n=1 Tax=Coptis chinensis TaxID=261450 RepID=A0A835I6Q6_9MAGN|nr:hypothetical protein IFM89_033613 [Coptis chinensis]
MGSEGLQAAKVYCHLLKAVKKHIGKEEHKRHFSDFINQEFHKVSDPSTAQQKIMLAHNYSYLLNSVHHHKANIVLSVLSVVTCCCLIQDEMVDYNMDIGDKVWAERAVFEMLWQEGMKQGLEELLFSYNIAVDRSDEVKRTLNKSAVSVGLQLPEVYQP